ncbi:hypothetical protein [Aquimarina sp. RZ0]|uniref:hypothetical protein n=1 Tax=Aquimarina sp. RZ0 TaxID=2607730 RepID=UPI0011F29D8A|nr:hypothetical protein [Aquimarina sp. RZ0]KAA1243095.1 hypothetical protein F0000_22605 [Aquimarina sp. RZ0]
MKKIKTIFWSLLLLLVISCANNDIVSSDLREITFLESSISAKKFVETDEFIDVDMRNGKLPIESMSDNEIAKLKAAVYRFYKTVKVENGKYTPPSLTAKQIKISDLLYESLYENILDMNEKLEDLAKDNEKFEVPEVTNEYLESLLD